MRMDFHEECEWFCSFFNGKSVFPTLRAQKMNEEIFVKWKRKWRIDWTRNEGDITSVTVSNAHRSRWHNRFAIASPSLREAPHWNIWNFFFLFPFSKKKYLYIYIYIFPFIFAFCFFGYSIERSVNNQLHSVSILSPFIQAWPVKWIFKLIIINDGTLPVFSSRHSINSSAIVGY